MTADEAFQDIAAWVDRGEFRSFRIESRTDRTVWTDRTQLVVVTIEQGDLRGHGLPWDDVVGSHTVEEPTLEAALVFMAGQLPPEPE